MGYVELYEKGLKDLGYEDAFNRGVSAPVKPGSGGRRMMYHLFFATDHPTGQEIMKHVFTRGYVLDFPVSGQYPLFD